MSGYQKEAKKYPILNKSLAFLQQEVFSLSDFKKITRLIKEIKYVGKYCPKGEVATTPPEKISLFILFNLISHFALALNEISSYAWLLSNGERDGYLTKRATYVDWDPRHADDLIKTTLILADRLSKEQHKEGLIIPEEFKKFPEPANLNHLKELINRFCKSYEYAWKVPVAIDVILFEYIFLNKKLDGDFKNNITQYLSLSDDVYEYLLNLCRNVIQYFINAGLVDEKYFKDISRT